VDEVFRPDGQALTTTPRNRVLIPSGCVCSRTLHSPHVPTMSFPSGVDRKHPLGSFPAKLSQGPDRNSGIESLIGSAVA
jgi:hypothetical protein